MPHRWVPRSYQRPVFEAWERGIKRFCLPWHRRSGKDDVALNLTACAMLQRPGTYWHLLPEKDQARKAVWNAIDGHTGVRRIDQAFPEVLRARTLDQEMMIEFKPEFGGSTWQLQGSDSYSSLVGSGPVGLVFSEYALADPGAWAFLRPIVRENGGWAMFISSVRGNNHFKGQYDYAVAHPGEWYASHLSVLDTGVLTQEQIDEELAELTAERGAKEAQAVVDQEYFSKWEAALPGAYYAEWMNAAQAEGRIGDFPWIPTLPVATAWDIGVNDETAIFWFQNLPNGRVRIIDCMSASQESLEYYAKIRHGRPYVTVEDIWPHDGAVREFGSGSRKTQARRLGLNPRVLKLESNLSAGISAVRSLLPIVEWNVNPLPFPGESKAQAWDRAKHARDCVSQYRRTWNEKLRAYNDHPLHDWTSHYASALRYLARGRKELAMPDQSRIAGPMGYGRDTSGEEYALTD